MSLVVVSWWWRKPDGSHLFGPEYLLRMRNMLARHLHREHEFVVVTDSAALVPAGIRTERITQWQDTPRCRRRVKQYDRAFAATLGTRILSIDLDVVIVDDITPLVDRREPIVCWRVGYAGVYSGSFVLYDFGALHGLYEAFAADPDGYPLATGERNASDQAMLNHFLAGREVPHWTERDGFVSYFGNGYEALEHHGVGPNRTELPEGARVVVLGSADKAAMDTGAHEWIEAHWC